MKYALMAVRPKGDYWNEHFFVREVFITMPDFHPGVVQDIRECPDNVEEGWVYINDTFQPQPPLQVPAGLATSTFNKRLKDSEYIALQTKAQDDLRSTATPDATLHRFISMAQVMRGFLLDDDLVKKAKAAMVSKNIVTQARADELFKV